MNLRDQVLGKYLVKYILSKCDNIVLMLKLTSIVMFAGVLTIAGSLMLLPVFAQTSDELPPWMKNTAGWWARGQISDSDFIQGMEFLVNQGIVHIPNTVVSEKKSDSVPEWVKSNAGWWADGMISDDDFVNGVQFMVEHGIMTLENSDKIMEMSSTDVAKKMSDNAREMIMDESAKTSTLVSDDVVDEGPLTTHTGEFFGLQGHNGEGIAKVIVVDDKHYLRFENFKVTNGPDLFVYVASDGDVSDGKILGRLKGSTGDQNYLLPEHIDISQYDTAVIYCKLFGVYFAEAPLK